MDTSDPWIEFDEHGICNHCKSFLFRYSHRVSPNLNLEADSLSHCFDSIRSRAHRSRSGFDAVMGISGGTDSSYCALLASRAGLRILAVHLDNGWDTPAALSNIYKLIQLPNIEYVSYVLPWNDFRGIQRSFIESGVPDIELPTDIAICKSIFKVAEKYNIRSAIGGGNISNEGILPRSWMYNARDMKFASSVALAGKVSKSSFSHVRFGFRDELYHRVFRYFRTFYPLNQIVYDKTLAVDALQRDIGWMPHKHKHSESVYTRFCQLIYQPTRHGFEYRRAHLSSDICMNRLSREVALQILAKPAMSSLEQQQDIDFVANKLGYTSGQLVSIMSQPPRWFSDFPHRMHMLGFAYDAYRFIKREPKLSNF